MSVSIRHRGGTGPDIQGKDAESEPDCTRTSSNGYELNDQDAGEEAGLERTGNEEFFWLERISKEEDNVEYIYQQDNDHEDHEEDD